MAVLTRRIDDWREPTAPTVTDAIAGSVMGVEYLYGDDLPPAPEPGLVRSWPLLASMVANVLLLGALVTAIVGR